MFGLSFTHLVLLTIIAIVFIGPEQLPEVARTFARLFNEWKRTTSDIQATLTNSIKEDLHTRTGSTEKAEVAAAAPHPEPPPAPSEEKKL